MKKFRHILALLIVAFCGVLGWWMAHDLGETLVQRPHRVSAAPVPDTSVFRAARPMRSQDRDSFRDGTTVEMFASSEPDEVILRFPSDETYGTFLFALNGSKIRLVSQLDRLRAMRLSYRDWADLSEFLGGENIVAYDALPSVPTPSPASASSQSGLLGFGDGLLPWLGINSDNSQWGSGVKIAVLDTGIVPHPALPGLTRSIEITPFPKDLNKTHGHGTAVASLIAGNDPSAPGVAPAAELISVRIGDESGKADSYALAAGILAAVDAGADLINISMGTSENNPLIEEAVLYAHQSNALIIAAAGNSEGAEALYPAAYPSVISVGAVDARGEHLNFSNYGSYLAVTAPGYAINAAWPGGRFSRMSGTSASAPIVTGAIAAAMSSGRGSKLSASQAAQLVMDYSDDAGIPGADSEYGTGILNVGRIMNRNMRNIVDAAITNQRFVKTGNSAEIQVTIQNRGTAVLVNTMLEIMTPFGSRQFNATTLASRAIQTFSMPVQFPSLEPAEPLQVSSHVSVGNPDQEATPYNNERTDTLYLK